MSKVLLVGKGFPDRGGIPTFLNTLRHGELGELHQITFLNVAHFDTPEGGEVTAGNISRTLRDARNVFRMAKGQDIVHIHSALAPAVTVGRAGLLGLAGRLRGAKVVMHAHGGNIETWLTTRRTRALMRLAMRPTSHVVAVWSAGEQTLGRALGPGRVSLIDNGVDTSRFVPAETDNHPPRVLYVGLLTPRKGVLDLIEASRLLRDEGVEHELLLLGGMPDEGPEAAEPVLAAAEGVARLLGTRPPEEMPAEYADADVFCLPSWWEAMPLSVLEAMSAGLPVVASDVGDVSRLVTPECGAVVPAKDPQRLADALRGLLVDPELRRRQGEASRRRAVEAFSSTATARAIDRLFHDVRHGDHA
ncbi:glycosyltransferase family 4 protein [Nocardioides sp.]|jgi:glycosyltransferase involved in cell wall biosynthesis|uniref:glycosyltransferase family 4 protein n=1 Tax=Nocardioides sp. TaxID=35761 RepID=UPI002F41D058